MRNTHIGNFLFNRAPLHFYGLQWSILEIGIDLFQIGCHKWSVDGLEKHYADDYNGEAKPQQRELILSTIKHMCDTQDKLGGIEFDAMMEV